MRTRLADSNPPVTTRSSYGYCQSNGVIAFPSSGDVTVTKTGTGSYTLNFNPPYPSGSLPVLTVMPYGGLQYVVVVTNAANNYISFVFATSPGGAGADSAFFFHVMGPAKK